MIAWLKEMPRVKGLECPACHHETIQRFGGPWCRWCRHFVYRYVKPNGEHAVAPYVHRRGL